MLFNSIDFFIFLPLVFILYWTFTKKLKLQNLVLLLSSYIFYSWWDYRFLVLIIASTIVDYFVGLQIHQSNNKKERKIWMFVSLFFNIGLLGFFKYYNFFIESIIDSLTQLGL